MKTVSEIIHGIIHEDALSEQGWFEHAPTEAGNYMFMCDEINFEPEPMTVTENLTVQCNVTGTWDVETYHANLTDPMWRKL